MNRSNRVFVAPALMLAAVLSFAGGAFAHDADEPAAASAKAALPDTAEGLWKAIDAKTVELKKTVDAGTLAKVHHEAYDIRDLVAALPGKSPNLSDPQKAKLQADVKFVATLAERLDASGDANDKAGTQSNYDKLVKVLGDLKMVYAGETKP